MFFRAGGANEKMFKILDYLLRMKFSLSVVMWVQLTKWSFPVHAMFLPKPSLRPVLWLVAFRLPMRVTLVNGWELLHMLFSIFRLGEPAVTSIALFWH
jgi:hypothetical protein